MTFVVLVGSMLSMVPRAGPAVPRAYQRQRDTVLCDHALYAFVTTGLRLLAATVTRNMSQAELLAILIFLPIVLVSNIHTPLEVMPPWFQRVVSLNPLAHYIDLTYGILLRGAGLDILWGARTLHGLIGRIGVWLRRVALPQAVRVDA
jgi:ABC-2 type transport system permease protein